MVKPRTEWRSSVLALNLNVHFSRMLFMKHQKHSPVILGSTRLRRIWMLHVCVHSDRGDKQSRRFICKHRDYLYSQMLRTRDGQGCRLTRAERGAHGARSGISPRGDARRWGSENGKSGRCDEGLQERKRGRERVEKKPRLSKNKFQRQQRYNKVTWISEQYRVKYWHYHTRVEE